MIVSHLVRILSLFVALAFTFIAGLRASPPVPAAVVNAASFGARPDDGLDDTKAINDALTEAARLGGGTVKLEAGQYVINSTADNNPVRMRSQTCLRGTVSAEGALQTVLFMPRAHSNRSLVVIGDPTYASEATDTVIAPEAVQRNVTLLDLRFDLDNSHGRRAIQLRFRTLGVSVRNCEGFQSGLDRGEPVDQTFTGDNHFFNLACYGRPTLREVSEDIEIVDCRVRGGLQLTSDGGAGVIGLRVQGNTVRGAFSHGIAVTTVGNEALFEDILIANNQVLEIGGDALYLGHDEGVTRNVNLKEGAVHRMSRVVIRDNTFALSTQSGKYANGLRFGSFVEFSGLRIEGNVIRGHDGGSTTSRFAVSFFPWDLNWDSQGKNSAATSASFSGDGTVRIPGHRFTTGMQVEVRPLTELDQPPAGIECFRRYIVRRVDADHIQLCTDRALRAVRFTSSTGTHAFRVVFSPAIEGVEFSNNEISDTWDYALRVDGSIGATFSENTIKGPVVWGLAHEGFRLVRNRFDRAFSTAPEGSSWLPSYEAASGHYSRPCLIQGNTWSIDENTHGIVYGMQAVINFDSRDPRRKLEFRFEENQVVFQPSPNVRFRLAVAEAGASGTLLAYYRDNSYGRATSLAVSQPLSVTSADRAPLWLDEASPKTPDPAPGPAPVEINPLPSRVVNLSIRAQAEGNENPLIAGFVISGTESKRVLIRAAGPALVQFGLIDAIKNPKLDVIDQGRNVKVASNDNWSTLGSMALETSSAAGAVGAFPFTSGSKDAAVVVTLRPGAYTAVVTDADGGSGISLVEVYDLDREGTSSRLTNVSARVSGLTGAKVPIVGFVLSGKASSRVLVRASGPALKKFVTSTTLEDPTLRLFRNSEQEPFVTNNNWTENTVLQPQIVEAAASVGAFSFSEQSLDAAAACTLEPGNYTAIVSDARGGIGMTLVEVYAVP